MGLEVVDISAEPSWPDAGGRTVLFLIEVGSRRERRLILEWIARSGSRGDAYRVVEVPSSRRRFGRRGVSADLRSFLDRDDDPLLAPVRVAWLAPEKDGRRTAGLLDLLLFGDPGIPARCGRSGSCGGTPTGCG